jgi:acetylornithine deacetylase/succinyl-diaminopimelate desuccinylase-like protein
MVPAWCEVEVDRRTLPGETAEQVTAELQSIVDRLAAGDPEFRGEVHPTAFEVASAVDQDAPIVRAAAAALRDLGLSTEPTGMAGATTRASWTRPASPRSSSVPATWPSPIPPPSASRLPN